LVSCLAGWLATWLIGWLVGWMDGWLVDWWLLVSIHCLAVHIRHIQLFHLMLLEFTYKNYVLVCIRVNNLIIFCFISKGSVSQVSVSKRKTEQSWIFQFKYNYRNYFGWERHKRSAHFTKLRRFTLPYARQSYNYCKIVTDGLLVYHWIWSDLKNMYVRILLIIVLTGNKGQLTCTNIKWWIYCLIGYFNLIDFLTSVFFTFDLIDNGKIQIKTPN
jgi:hypothetical protein